MFKVYLFEKNVPKKYSACVRIPKMLNAYLKKVCMYLKMKKNKKETEKGIEIMKSDENRYRKCIE